MKGITVIFLCLLSILVSQYVLAYHPPYKGDVVYRQAPPQVVKAKQLACNSCGYGYQSNNCDGDSCAALEGCGGGCGGWGGCSSCTSGVCGSCNCTDPGCGRNPCLSARRCCRVFGNIGAGDFDYPCDFPCDEV